MSNENDPWVVRLSERAPSANGNAMYLQSVLRNGESFCWLEDVRFARRFTSKNCAVQAAARYIESSPCNWGRVRVVRLVKKAAPCA